MEQFLLYAVIVLFIICTGLFLYILSLRHNLASITRQFQEKLEQDTSTPISVTLVDQKIRELADSINTQLLEFRKQKMAVQKGKEDLNLAVTGLVHDIRTPLSAMKGYIQLLEVTDLDENGRKYVSIVHERCDALTQLIEDLFQYYLVKCKKDTFQCVSLDLKKEIEIALAGAYSLLNAKGIEPVVDFPKTSVIVVCGNEALQRVFSNILNNCARYSDGDLHVKLKEDGTVIFSNHACRLSHVETERLFDRFFTVNNAKGSTGIGLSVSKHLMENMHGTMKAVYDQGIVHIIVCIPQVES